MPITIVTRSISSLKMFLQLIDISLISHLRGDHMIILMIKTQTFQLSLISGLILMALMIAFGTTPARAEDNHSAQKGTAYYQFTQSYE
ncbi:hypothetical protein BH09PAT2_BH09PAT2_10440 [soil metagenome]